MADQPNHDKIKEIASTDNGFKFYVVQTLTSLETNMSNLVGNGQPGRVKILEDKVEQHGKYIYGAIIGLIVLEGVLHYLVAPMVAAALHAAGH